MRSPVQSKLIVVFASSGKTASLVAKYRPPMPIMCLVVPRLKSRTLSWTMEGRSVARQLLLVRGGPEILALHESLLSLPPGVPV